MGEFNLKKIINNSSFYMLNKFLLKEIGIESSLMLSCLMEAEEIFEEEWFYQTSETIEKLTTLTRKKQDSAIKILIDKKIIEKKVYGIPAKRFFKINAKIVLELISNNGTNKFAPNGQTTMTNLDKNKEHIYKNINNKERQIKKVVNNEIDNNNNTKECQSVSLIKYNTIRFIQLLQNYDIRFSPTECNMIIGICEEIQLDPMTCYNLSKYLRGETSAPLSKRMFLRKYTYDKMKLGDYNDKDFNKPIKEVKHESRPLTDEQKAMLKKNEIQDGIYDGRFD